MILQWLVYALTVSALLAAAAWLAERAARAQGWPTRWIWATAIAGSLGLPLLRWLHPSAPPAPTAGPGAALPRFDLLQILPEQTPAAAAVGVEWGEVVLTAWAAATVLIVAGIVGISVRLWQRRRTWRVHRIDHLDVLVSPATGPAALGLLRGRVVLPEWALGLNPARRRLLVTHEAEHVRAGDPRLAFAGLLAWAMAPWNLPVAWQLRRLRLAIEVDCDARVLRRCGDRHAYGSLLLEVGQRRTRLALALVEPRSLLERRIRMITMNARKQTTRAAALAAAAVLLLVAACETSGPVEPAAPVPEPAERVEEEPVRAEPVAAPSAKDLSDRPVFTPMTVRPQLENPEEVVRALKATYPPLLRDAGIGGTVGVWFFIDRSGTVRRTLIQESSGREALDAAALRVAETLRFTPARNGDERVPVWVAIPITFEPDPAAGEAAEAAGDRDAALERKPGSAAPLGVPARGAGIAAAPTFTPMTVRPELRNARQVASALVDLYPPLLRDAGISGTTNVWFSIDETGRVLQTRIAKSSGRAAFDQAALEVAERMEFTPAYNREEPVRAWVAIPITFEVE